MAPITMEVCVDSVQSAINAVQGGANRLELCSNVGIGGGTTPSLGLLRSVQKVSPSLPIMVMIRPRMGDFLYAESELEVMLEDIRIFKQHGVQGVVVGILTGDGRVDIKRTQRLVDEAWPLEVCFHRAFDMTPDPDEALRDVLAIDGITRILTSGQGIHAPSSLDRLGQLYASLQQLKGSNFVTTTLLPGSGINAVTVGPLLNALVPLGLREVHLSGAGWVDSAMSFRRRNMGMGIGQAEWMIWLTQEDNVKQVRQIIDATWQDYTRSSEAALLQKFSSNV